MSKKQSNCTTQGKTREVGTNILTGSKVIAKKFVLKTWVAKVHTTQCISVFRLYSTVFSTDDSTDTTRKANISKTIVTTQKKTNAQH